MKRGKKKDEFKQEGPIPDDLGEPPRTEAPGKSLSAEVANTSIDAEETAAAKDREEKFEQKHPRQQSIEGEPITIPPDVTKDVKKIERTTWETTHLRLTLTKEKQEEIADLDAHQMKAAVQQKARLKASKLYVEPRELAEEIAKLIKAVME
jgi:hypothetical protein